MTSGERSSFIEEKQLGVVPLREWWWPPVSAKLQEASHPAFVRLLGRFGSVRCAEFRDFPCTCRAEEQNVKRPMDRRDFEAGSLLNLVI